MEFNIGDQVSFTDKTGEYMRGIIQRFGQINNDPNLATVLAYKPSWDMEINCLVSVSHLALADSKDDQKVKNDRLAQAVINDIERDIENQDYTALDEMLVKLATIPEAKTLLVGYLSDDVAESFGGVF